MRHKLFVTIFKLVVSFFIPPFLLCAQCTWFSPSNYSIPFFIWFHFISFVRLIASDAQTRSRWRSRTNQFLTWQFSCIVITVVYDGFSGIVKIATYKKILCCIQQRFNNFKMLCWHLLLNDVKKIRLMLLNDRIFSIPFHFFLIFFFFFAIHLRYKAQAIWLRRRYACRCC